MSTDQTTTTKPRESPQDAPERETDALLAVFRDGATEAELSWLRHQIERGLAARALRLERRAA